MVKISVQVSLLKAEWRDVKAVIANGFEIIWSFHSISFPSEWGHVMGEYLPIYISKKSVSIQLISPASGDYPEVEPGYNVLVKLSMFPFN